jgi:hypothetical protein
MLEIAGGIILGVLGIGLLCALGITAYIKCHPR